jgi:N-acetylglucosaminyl-diphospho-decaprenol L-rhamnosyltransferase
VPTLAVTYSGMLGGAERTLVDFTGALPDRVVLACPEGPLAAHARDHGLTVFPISARRPELRRGLLGRVRAVAALGGHARELRRLTRALDPDLVLAWGMRSAIAAPVALARVQGRPALLIRHVDFLPGPLIARLMRASCARAERVSVNSHAVARDLDPHDRLSDRLSVVSPGVELGFYRPEWQVGADPEVLLLGTLMPWKRPDLALEAVAVAARELPRVRLTLAGASMNPSGERFRAELRRRAEQPDLAGRVDFIGEVRDHRDALRRAWCLLHCAEREPFGTVVVQAMAAGRPVVAPATAGPAEVVDESCGRLYSAGDAGAAAAALVDVLSSPERARALGAAARARAAEYDARAAQRRFARIARDALAARASDGRPNPGNGAAPGVGMALVTVTHNSSADVARLLRSVRRHLPGAAVVVVDSGSSDSSCEAARTVMPQATVIELGENAGFGKASNEGVRRVSEPVCVLINPDAELLDDSVASLADELRVQESAERIFAPLVLSPDGSRQATAQLDPASPLLRLRALVPPAAIPGRLRTLVDPWRSNAPRRVDWAVACCLVARTETLRRLGPFDERIFLFSEDLDLGLRAAAADIETWFCPSARVLHLDAQSTTRVFGGEPFDLLARQRRAVVGERRGERAARRDHWIWLATYANRLALKALSRRPTARERRQLAAQWRARKAPARLAARRGPG